MTTIDIIISIVVVVSIVFATYKYYWYNFQYWNKIISKEVAAMQHFIKDSMYIKLLIKFLDDTYFSRKKSLWKYCTLPVSGVL